MRNYSFVFICTLLLIVCIQSCSKCKSTDSGIIVRTLNTCDSLLYYIDTPHIINGSGQYYYYCNGQDSVDLDQYSIIYHYASGGGCDIAFHHKVTIDDRNKKYISTVYVCESGLCKMLGFYNKYVLIPKLPAGWAVEYQVLE